MNQRSNFLKKLLLILAPLAIIVGGVLVMWLMISLRSAPQKEVRTDPGILVKVLEAHQKDTVVIVRGTGTVEAEEEVSIIPQVNGRIIKVSTELHVGGFFKKGEVLFEIEDLDYRLALEQAMAARAKAEYELATIESQAKIARTEWEHINKDASSPPNPLVLYEPQLKSAKAALASSTASVRQATLDLERTKIKAPFNARVRSEDVDPGQYVRTGSIIVILAGTDTAEISVPLPMDNLQWLKIPRHGQDSSGASAEVNMNVAGKQYRWTGHVVRSTGEVDPKSRMMNIVVEVDDPYALKGGRSAEGPALAVGTFVNVEMKGKNLKNVFIIPRIAFRDNATVWTMDETVKMKIKKVRTVRIERDEVIIDKGIENGDKIILTNISGAANGMKLREIK
jgi:RND family efflux transporter MFP subunit